MDTTKEEILLFKSLKKDAINRIKRSFPFLRDYMINISDIEFYKNEVLEISFFRFNVKLMEFGNENISFEKLIRVEDSLLSSDYFTKEDVFTRVLNVELDKIRKQIEG